MEFISNLFGKSVSSSVASRLQPPKAPGYEKHSFVPNFAKLVDNATTSVPKSTGRVLATMRRSPENNPSETDTNDATNFVNEGFIDRVKPQQDNSIKAMWSKYWDAKGEKVDASTANYGHQGLASYITTCWAREKGVVLRPDMIWSTICGEFARDVIENSKSYRSLYTNSSKKTTLLILNPLVDFLPIKLVIQALNSAVPSKELLELITSNHCPTSAAPGFIEATSAFFAYSATPFYDYVSFKCGIPFFDLQGPIEEWKAVAAAIGKLEKLVPAEASKFAKYLKRCHKLTEEITNQAFSDWGNNQNLVDAQSFFSGMFYITSSCGSGHPYYCQGWLSELYYKNPEGYASFCNVKDFPTHMGIVPWKQLETERMFVSCTGLFYSVESEDKSFLIPHYGQIQYEMMDKSLFEKLKL